MKPLILILGLSFTLASCSIGDVKSPNKREIDHEKIDIEKKRSLDFNISTINTPYSKKIKKIMESINVY